MLQVQFIKSQFIFILVWRFLKTITDGMDQFDAAAALVAESGDNLNPFDRGKVAPLVFTHSMVKLRSLLTLL